jgi:hypothetical protein
MRENLSEQRVKKSLFNSLHCVEKESKRSKKDKKDKDKKDKRRENGDKESGRRDKTKSKKHSRAEKPTLNEGDFSVEVICFQSLCDKSVFLGASIRDFVRWSVCLSPR